MKIIDPGHRYELEIYDGKFSTNYRQHLQFMKRKGPMYPGNSNSYPGTNIQEVLRVLIDRIKYLDNQIHSNYNDMTIAYLRCALESLELRAAERHGNLDLTGYGKPIETYPPCKICGHIICKH